MDIKSSRRPLRRLLRVLIVPLALIAIGAAVLFLGFGSAPQGEPFRLKPLQAKRIGGTGLSVMLVSLSPGNESPGSMGLCGASSMTYVLRDGFRPYRQTCHAGCLCQPALPETFPYTIEQWSTDYSTYAEFRVYRKEDSEARGLKDCEAITEDRAAGDWQEVRSECFRSLAERYGKPAYCNQSVTDRQWYCWQDVLRDGKMSMPDCETIPDSPRGRDMCWVAAASVKSDPVFCKRAFSEPKFKDDCLANIIGMKDAAACADIGDESKRRDCERLARAIASDERIRTARTVADCSPIEGMAELESAVHQQRCYTAVAQWRFDAGICDMIGDIVARNGCTFLVTRDLRWAQNMELHPCERIVVTTERDQCWHAVARYWPEALGDSCGKISDQTLAASCGADVAERKGPTKTVLLHYYDPTKDVDGSGNVLCGPAGLVPVERAMAVDAGPVDAVRLLLYGALTEEERRRGISTEFPLTNLVLVSGSLNDGTFTLTFHDRDGKTVGGACRVGVLRSQIEATAKQFPEVREVRFMPVGVFQP